MESKKKEVIEIIEDSYINTIDKANLICALFSVVGQSEQLPDDDEETKCPDHTPYWGVCSTCGQY